MGEYPLAWSAFLCNEGLYNLLLMKGADPDAQDTYGNTVLHMVVVGSQLGMYGYALRHPKKCGNPYIKNNRGLTPLTLSCELGRDEIFRYHFQSKNISSTLHPQNNARVVLYGILAIFQHHMLWLPIGCTGLYPGRRANKCFVNLFYQ